MKKIKHFVLQNLYLISIFSILFCCLFFSPFLLLYVFSFILLHVSNKVKKNTVFPLIILFILSLILISRDQNGGSTYHQINAYLNMTDFFNITTHIRQRIASYDFLFWHISYIVRIFADNKYIFFLWFWAFFSISSIMWAYKKILPKYWIFAFLIFTSSLTFYYIPGNTIRQSAALGFFIISIAFAHHKYVYHALFFVICAAFCHISTYLLLPFFILLSFKLVTRKLMIYLLAISFLFSSFNILKIINQFCFFSTFLYNKVFSYSYKIPATFISRQFIVSCSIILILYFYKNLFKIDLKKYSTFINCYLYTLALQISFKFSNVYWDRLACYKNILQNILIVILISKLKQKKMILTLLICICLFYNLYALSSTCDNFMNGLKIKIITTKIDSFIKISLNSSKKFYQYAH